MPTGVRLSDKSGCFATCGAPENGPRNEVWRELLESMGLVRWHKENVAFQERVARVFDEKHTASLEYHIQFVLPVRGLVVGATRSKK